MKITPFPSCLRRDRLRPQVGIRAAQNRLNLIQHPIQILEHPHILKPDHFDVQPIQVLCPLRIVSDPLLRKMLFTIQFYGNLII